MMEHLEDRSLLSVAPLSETFQLHSAPGADHTIYLDFDGHVTSGTYWNTAYNNGADIVTPAYDFDGETSSFSNAELERIQWIWARTAEDFIPFEVDVTTEDPGAEALKKSGGGDTQWGIRVVIGGSSYDWFGQGAGGVAYLGSFNWSNDTPTFVFDQQLGNGNEKYTAEAASHETGHTLGLHHDGRTVPSEGYYQGHGSGATGWAPVMGVGYYQQLTQWSKGEYLNANQTEDDLAIVTSRNGFNYRDDDHADDSASATALTVSLDAVSGDGIIETSTDTDFFTFSTGAGSISLNVDPAQRGPNLDILAELYDASDTLVAWSNPADFLDAEISASVPAGRYYLSVTGVGKGDPLGTGYTDYASLGQYSITGTIVPADTDYLSLAPTDAVKAEGDAGTTSFTFTVTRTGNLSGSTTVNYAVSGSGASAADAEDFENGVFPSGTVSFGPEENSKDITVLVRGDSDAEDDEGFKVTLSGASGTTQITGPTAHGTIQNDDAAPQTAQLAIAATDASKPEGNEGSTNFVFTVTRTGGLHATTVEFAVTARGKNSADQTDFGGVLPSGTVQFDADDVTQTITIHVSGDTTREKNEGFTVTLSNPGPDTVITTDTASGTIVNDDGKSGGKGGGKGGAKRGGWPDAPILEVAPVPNLEFVVMDYEEAAGPCPYQPAWAARANAHTSGEPRSISVIPRVPGGLGGPDEKIGLAALDLLLATDSAGEANKARADVPNVAIHENPLAADQRETIYAEAAEHVFETLTDPVFDDLFPGGLGL
jgi:hypothetical protein